MNNSDSHEIANTTWLRVCMTCRIMYWELIREKFNYLITPFCGQESQKQKASSHGAVSWVTGRSPTRELCWGRGRCFLESREVKEKCQLDGCLGRCSGLAVVSKQAWERFHSNSLVGRHLLCRELEQRQQLMCNLRKLKFGTKISSDQLCICVFLCLFCWFVFDFLFRISLEQIWPWTLLT